MILAGPLSKLFELIKNAVEFLLREPVVLESLLFIVLVLVVFLFLSRIKKIAGELKKRKAIREFIHGMDAYIKKEYSRTIELLARVVERDPENMEARICLGDALRELGNIAEAHKQHFHVFRVFHHENVRNFTSLGKDLIAQGKPKEALPYFERALQMDPENTELLYLFSSALEQQGAWAKAAEHRKKIMRKTPSSHGRQKLSFSLGRLYLKAGLKDLEEGNKTEAVSHLEEAVKHNPGLIKARLALASVRPSNKKGHRKLETSVARQLKEIKQIAGKKEVLLDLLPESAITKRPAGDQKAGARTHLLEAASLQDREKREGEILPPDLLSSILPESPRELGKMAVLLSERGTLFQCSACRDIQFQWSEICEGCSAMGTLSQINSLEMQPVPNIKELMDEIDENEEYIKRLITRLVRGELEAEKKLLGIGSRIIDIVFSDMMRVKDNLPLVRLMSRMGLEHLPQILDAYKNKKSLSARNPLKEGVNIFKSYDAILLKILVGIEEGVEEFIVQKFLTQKGELKEIGISVLALRGEAEFFETYSELLHPKEVISGLNSLEGGDLKRIIENAPPAGFLASKVFPDKTFQHEKGLVESLVRGGDTLGMTNILIQRGFSAEIYQCLEPLLGRERLGEPAKKVIQSFGSAAIDHLISSYVAPETTARVRKELGNLLLLLGQQPVERLIDSFTGRYLKVEKALVDLLAMYGDASLRQLMDSYRKETMLHRVGFNREKLTHRRKQIIRILSRMERSRPGHACCNSAIVKPTER